MPLNDASHERSASIAGLDLPGADREKTALDSHASGSSMSIDILRAEVERDAAVDDHQSAYDRMYETLSKLKCAESRHVLVTRKSRDPGSWYTLLTHSRQIQGH